MKTTAILLAAGQGTRMRSDLPKVLHRLCGKPMLWYSLEAVKQASSEQPVVIIGAGGEKVKEYIGEAALCVQQEPQLGTAHAVIQAESLLKGRTDQVIVAYADMPLLRGETLRRLAETQSTNRGAMTLLTVTAADPRGFGRIVRDASGAIHGIVEEYVATPEQLAIHELNVGAYCFSAEWLWQALHSLQVSPKGEYYLTDTVALAVQAGLKVEALVIDDLAETIGINTRVHLAEAEAAMRRRINQAHMLK